MLSEGKRGKTLISPNGHLDRSGAPGEIRTPDLLVSAKGGLYPAQI